MSGVALALTGFFACCAFGVCCALVVPERLAARFMGWIAAGASLFLFRLGALGVSGHGFAATLGLVHGVGPVSIALHPLGAIFLCITALVYLPTSIFATAYLQRYVSKYRLRAFAIEYHALFASIAGILLADDVIAFFIAWEAMTVLGYLLVVFEYRRPENLQAGFVMLGMSEAGAIAALAAFLLLAHGGPLGFADLSARAHTLAPAVAWAVFLLSFVGFGVKAGLIPVNSWLPMAHPVAPAPISAILSGVILNLGVYGILLVNWQLAPIGSIAPGLIVLAVGAASALIGILYAAISRDMKAMLAYSSIENIGLAVAAAGAGFVLAAVHQVPFAILALVAALYHLLNHSIYKGLLFLGAGAIDACAGTRDMTRLGRLLRYMPLTSTFFTIGALSIAAVPPFNGFVSEWLILKSVLHLGALGSIGASIVFAASAFAIALTAVLAFNLFMKVLATNFLTSPGGNGDGDAPQPREAAWPMLLGMGLLGAGCIALGVLARYIAPVLASAFPSLATGADLVDAFSIPMSEAARAVGNAGAMIPLTAFFGICLAGILTALVVPQRVAARCMGWIAALASLFLFWLGASGLAGHSLAVTFGVIPGFGRVAIALHPTGAVFLCIAALVYLPTSIFATAYLNRYLHEYPLRGFAVEYHALFASIAGILLAADVVSFFIAWEAMAIFSALLVAYEYRQRENVRAGYVMLAMSEAGTIAALVAMLLLGRGGALDFTSLAVASHGLAPALLWAVFLLSFFGFGVKAGLIPVNAWLPMAHPVAPGPISAVLSGMILNLGVYGIVLVNWNLAPIPLLGPGLVMLVVGTASALLGILRASTNDDMKGMLAYSSIENIGLAIAALGAGFIFMAEQLAAFAVIAFVAAVYHLLNHSAYKALLFLGAASVDLCAGTRDMNRLGGLVKFMPRLTIFFLIGALAIAAAPPLNGFVSEWVLFESLLRSAAIGSIGVRVVFAVCGAALALTAALAITCFAKAFGMSFLGVRRSAAPVPRDPPRAMAAALAFLSLACFVLGVTPTYLIPILGKSLSALPIDAASVLVPPFFAPEATPQEQPLPVDFVKAFHDLGAQIGQHLLPGRGLVVMLRGGESNPVVFAMSTGYMIVLLALLIAAVYLVVRLAVRRKQTVRAPWNAGLAHVDPAASYTARGFSNPIAVIFAALVRPMRTWRVTELAARRFLGLARGLPRVPFVSDTLVSVPVAWITDTTARTLAQLHQGRLNAYAAYALITLLIVLVGTTIRF